MAALPILSDRQRSEGLAKGTAVRIARRAFKDAVAAGTFDIGQAIHAAKADDALAGIRCIDLLLSLPGVGPKRAERLMQRAGIAASRRVRGIGEHQLASLIRERRR